MALSAVRRFGLAQTDGPWRIWSGAVVAFDVLSGDTHRIEAPAGHILALVSESPHSTSTLQSALGPEVSMKQIDETLDLLLAMELVEPV